jgi:hypothetical protein
LEDGRWIDHSTEESCPKGEGNGERGGYVGAQKEINAGVQDKVRRVSYSWLAANKTFHIKHALKQRHIVFFRSNRKK